MFVAIAKRDLGLKEAWEIGRAIRMWNARWGSPFSKEQVEEFIRIPPAEKKDKKRKPALDQQTMFQDYIDERTKIKKVKE